MRRMKDEVRRMKSGARFRRGFSFTEIMFAVVILGIGFIMVSAIFPVALQQTKITSEEITAAPIARGAINIVGQFISDNASGAISVARTSNILPTGTPARLTGNVMQFPTIGPLEPPNSASLWNTLRGNLIQPQDPRYAWIVLYLRGGDPTDNPTALATWKPYIRLFMFPVQVRAKDIFREDDVTLFDPLPFNPKTNYSANLMARQVQVAVANDVLEAGGSDLLAFDLRPGQMIKENVTAAIEGAYVVIANDKLIDTPPGTAGRMNGRVYKLGARRADLDVGYGAVFGESSWGASPGDMEVYELQPGNDFQRDPGVDERFYNVIGNPSDRNDIAAIGNKDKIISNNSDIQTDSAAYSTNPTADAFLIGKGYADPSNPAGGYADTAMPIGAYVTFIRVK